MKFLIERAGYKLVTCAPPTGNFFRLLLMKDVSVQSTTTNMCFINRQLELTICPYVLKLNICSVTKQFFPGGPGTNFDI